MNRQQLKYFLSLDPENRKRALAQLLLIYLKIFENVKGEDFEERMEKIREEMMKVNIEPRIPVIEGVNQYLVKGEDLMKLLDLDQNIGEMIDELKITRRKLKEIVDQVADEIISIKTGA